MKKIDLFVNFTISILTHVFLMIKETLIFIYLTWYVWASFALIYYICK